MLGFGQDQGRHQGGGGYPCGAGAGRNQRPRLSWWPVELQEGSAGGTPSDLTGAAEPELQERAPGNFFEHSDGDTPAGSRWMARPRREFWGSRAFRKCSNGAELGLPGLGRARSLWSDS